MTDEAFINLTRNGKRSFYGTNNRGATVHVGDEEGQFNPGELLVLALAACQTMSADGTLANKLGPDFTGHGRATRRKDEANNLYEHIGLEYEVTPAESAQDLSPDQLASLIRLAHKAVDRNCTVGRTINHGPTYSLDLNVQTGAEENHPTPGEE